MGGFISKPNRIKCFNELNTRFYHKDTNYSLKLHECNKGLDASYLREFPKGCYTYVCEHCYYEFYLNNDNPPDDIYTTSTTHPTCHDNIQLRYDENSHSYYSRIPVPEWEREMVDGEWPDHMMMDKPIWKEIPSGIDVIGK